MSQLVASRRSEAVSRLDGSPRRVLVIDDNRQIHEDFRKILQPARESEPALDALEAELFGGVFEEARAQFALAFAAQGQEGVEIVEQALLDENPFALAFIDMRMPPGWDGIETIENLWKLTEDLEVVICSAYSDHSWRDIVQRLGTTDGLLILKKPFDNAEVLQVTHALASKWSLRREVERRLEDQETAIRERTRELEETNDRLTKEMESRLQIETELRLAQKLEAVGQLAAGIAHEINTPTQFVGDNVHFLESAFEDMNELLGEYRAVLGGVELSNDAQSKIQIAEETYDLAYLTEQVPVALASSADGIARVAGIVHAMKEFAHPDQRDKTMVDINRALDNTLTVATNEYKYVADVERDFGTLPQVACHAGDINQVFLNLIVNAAHAIDASPKEPDERGVITLETRHEDGIVEIAISDTGTGIPTEIRVRIFDPFFTTKEVGKGTGQGLAIARSVVVDKHGGELRVESELGQGTKFIVRIPVGHGEGSEPLSENGPSL